MTVDAAPMSKEDQFREVYARAFPAILSYVRRRLPPGTRGELDVTSEIFAVAWRRIDDVPPPPEDLLWIYGVARNCLARFYRDRSRQLRLYARIDAEPASVAAPDGADEIHEFVRAAVARLPEIDREAITLVHWDGLTHDEVASVLGLTANAVELRLRRARARLRRDLVGLLRTEADVNPLPPHLLPCEGMD
jgi:RNA polymerase sigma factor (sigma-70 family)